MYEIYIIIHESCTKAHQHGQHSRYDTTIAMKHDHSLKRNDHYGDELIVSNINVMRSGSDYLLEVLMTVCIED